MNKKRGCKVAGTVRTRLVRDLITSVESTNPLEGSILSPSLIIQVDPLQVIDWFLSGVLRTNFSLTSRLQRPIKDLSQTTATVLSSTQCCSIHSTKGSVLSREVRESSFSFHLRNRRLRIESQTVNWHPKESFRGIKGFLEANFRFSSTQDLSHPRNQTARGRSSRS
jgi:hypothetical protein